MLPYGRRGAGGYLGKSFAGDLRFSDSECPDASINPSSTALSVLESKVFNRDTDSDDSGTGEAGVHERRVFADKSIAMMSTDHYSSPD